MKNVFKFISMFFVLFLFFQMLTPVNKTKNEIKPTFVKKISESNNCENIPQEEETEINSYKLTQNEREYIEHIVMCEKWGEDEKNTLGVAQCILNACLRENEGPFEALPKYGYKTYSVTVNDSVKNAVHRVFDLGERVTEEYILFYYSPANMPNNYSYFHESQHFVFESGGHRFFSLEK